MNNEHIYTETTDYESIIDMADRLMGNELPDDTAGVIIESENDKYDAILEDDLTLSDISDEDLSIENMLGDYLDNDEAAQNLIDSDPLDIDRDGIDDGFETFDSVDFTGLAD
jgi:hypothetical protein